MPRDLYIGRGLSASTITAIAGATRTLCDIGDREDFDIIRFLEVEVGKILPDFYLFIESDAEMNGSKAFVTEDSNGIVVAESVYNDACGGLYYARKILAHEFGHVLLHHKRGHETKHFSVNGYRKQIQGTEVYHSAEWQADTFAIVLLISPSQVSNKTKPSDLSIRYKMSLKQAEFILKRLNNIRLGGRDYNRSVTEAVLRELLAKRSSQQAMANQLSLFG
ncbi:MAG: ImmA/IrrE family metallo-endopeptidase [Allorhizobium sp.]|uniref:ImmA/IrrE family metallo-endopeptidase n=1 Tax=Allorhizobium sp. TaxID=633478 RepID=UPI004033654A